jgi:tryptophanyl-tRNA synthetase
MWILSCHASTGYLSRMTQWKEKTSAEKKGGERLKLGLFSYPVLQAADVLIHRASHVPVGQDQAQHLEFARELAAGFNHVYGSDILRIPGTIVSPAKRIMSLTEPHCKMSKSSGDPKSRILLTDSEDEIRAKIRTAITDSLPGIKYLPTKRPGVSNLLDLIYYSTGARGTQEDLAEEIKHISFRAVKQRAIEAVEGVVRPIREKYAEVVQNERLLERVAADGAEKARESASHTMNEVRKAIGFV